MTAMKSNQVKTRKSIKAKQPGKLTKGVSSEKPVSSGQYSCFAGLWLHCPLCMTGFELIDHPSYSRDLTPSDYFLFPIMEKHLAGNQYQTDYNVISAVEDFFEGQEELLHYWNPCTAA